MARLGDILEEFQIKRLMELSELKKRQQDMDCVYLLESMTKKQLLELAQDNGIHFEKIIKYMKKTFIIENILEALKPMP